ncbi:acetyl-CoA C-acyltransferase [Pararhodonellum marinum]|uniref:acetyl-CoA C-acyltransferase n=1 Tax=Pararhodonellum marinum TaxID=2755358 RepID=UPI001890A830|nr:acetyl-CoA C-acyltransferase [Pararhodonellum marinum]
MKTAYVIEGVRTPIAKFKGGLSLVRADDLAAFVIKALTDKFPELPKEAIDDVILGCHNQAGEDNRNVARMAALLAGLPVSVPGETINRLCASGMSAVVHAKRAIQAGDGDLFIAGGVEHMTRGPYVLAKPSTAFGNDATMYDSSFGWRFVNSKMEESYGVDPMGITAENLVEKFGISREDQDKFALASQLKAAKARENGRFAKEIIPIIIPSKRSEAIVFAEDEFIREDTTIEKLSALNPAFKKGGSVTAGNSSGLNDGAAAMLVASENAVKKFGLTPSAKILSTAVVGVEPRLMGIGPVEAANQALAKAGIGWDQLDVIELNEAFAAQALACIRAWGLDDEDPRINPNGGAIALGHPLGMSGTRIIQTAALELQLKNRRYALATLCVGVGQGYAVVLERV